MKDTLSDNRRLSLKKKKRKKETQNLIKRSNHLFTKQKKQKKKKKKIKNPKTQNVFPDQNLYSLRLQILLCSFKHTDRPCVATKTLKPKLYLPIKIQTHSDHRFFAVPSNTQIGLACSTLSQYGWERDTLQKYKKHREREQLRERDSVWTAIRTSTG